MTAFPRTRSHPAEPLRDASRRDLRLGGGLPALLALLAPGRDPAVLRYAAEAVGLLVDGDAAARELVAALDGAEKLRQARAASGTQGRRSVRVAAARGLRSRG